MWDSNLFLVCCVIVIFNSIICFFWIFRNFWYVFLLTIEFEFFLEKCGFFSGLIKCLETIGTVGFFVFVNKFLGMMGWVFEFMLKVVNLGLEIDVINEVILGNVLIEFIIVGFCWFLEITLFVDVFGNVIWLLEMVWEEMGIEVFCIFNFWR